MDEGHIGGGQLVPFVAVAVAEQLVNVVVGQHFVVAFVIAGKLVGKLLDYQANLGYKSPNSETVKPGEAVLVSRGFAVLVLKIRDDFSIVILWIF